MDNKAEIREFLGRGNLAPAAVGAVDAIVRVGQPIMAIEPLHSAAPEAVENWSELGEVLALLDSLRAGDARVRKVAGDFLSKMLRERSVVAGG